MHVLCVWSCCHLFREARLAHSRWAAPALGPRWSLSNRYVTDQLGLAANGMLTPLHIWLLRRLAVEFFGVGLRVVARMVDDTEHFDGNTTG